MPSAARRVRHRFTGTVRIRIESAVIGSVCRLLPRRSNPGIALPVTVNEAKVKPDYGGTAAAPFAAQIFEEILPLLGVAKTEGRRRSQTDDHAGCDGHERARREGDPSREAGQTLTR